MANKKAVLVLAAVGVALWWLSSRRQDGGGFMSVGWPFRKLEPSTRIVSVAGLRG